LAQELLVSHENGFHGLEFNLELSCDKCDEIWYSIDGSDPKFRSKYSSPILISKNLVKENSIALIPTTVIPNIGKGEKWHHWLEPGEYEKAVPIKIGGYLNGELITSYAYRTYFFESDWHLFPTFSLNIDPSELFDDSLGLFVPGIFVEPGNSIWTGNYHRKGENWERPVHVTYLKDSKTEQDKDLGMRIHGLKAGSAPQKSIRLYARKKYGSKSLNYQFEKGESKKHKRLLLRTPYSVHSSKIISDVVAHELARRLDIDIMDYGFARTFINGEYWGLHSVRERIDEHYLMEHYKVDKQDLIIPGNYDQPEFQQMFNILDSNDISIQNGLEKLGQILDLSNFTDYVICETYFRNTDWLVGNNNVTFWKERGKGKWRLVLIDMDACFQNPESDMIEFMKQERSSMISKLFFELMKNEAYKATFVSRYTELLLSDLSPKNCFHIIDSISQFIEPEMVKHIERWGHPTSVFDWKQDLDNMKDFVNIRATSVGKELEKHFDINTSEMNKVEAEFFISQDKKIIGLSFFGIILIIGFVIYYRRRKRKEKKRKARLDLNN
jgi:hypothetical protein